MFSPAPSSVYFLCPSTKWTKGCHGLHVYVPYPPKTRVLNLTLQCDGIWRWGPWAVMRSWEWMGLVPLHKQRPESYLAVFIVWGYDKSQQKRTIIRMPPSGTWTLDFWPPELRNLSVWFISQRSVALCYGHSPNLRKRRDSDFPFHFHNLTSSMSSSSMAVSGGRLRKFVVFL